MKKILFIVIVAALAGGVYYYFIDTQKFSEVTGKTGSRFTDSIVSLVDFDTGLTRYDVYRIKHRRGYWQAKMDKVAAIKDASQREIEYKKLMDEMKNDSTLKKLIDKGMDKAGEILKGME